MVRVPRLVDDVVRSDAFMGVRSDARTVDIMGVRSDPR